MIYLMNKALVITAVAFVFASALVIVSTGVMQSANACPDKSSAAASKVIPAAPNLRRIEKHHAGAFASSDSSELHGKREAVGRKADV